MDYSNLGLDDQLRSVNSPTSGTTVQSLGFESNYEMPTGVINYTNLSKDARPYDAVVSLSGELGTFKDIQLAINYVNSLGGGKVLIKSGKYYLLDNITMYSGVSLIGEGFNKDTILSFSDLEKSIIFDGILRHTTLSNFEIRQNKFAGGAVNVNDCDYIDINNIYFNQVTTGIGFGTAYNFICKISDIIMGYPDTGMLIKGSRITYGNFCYFNNIYIKAPKYSGFEIQGGENNTYFNCRTDLATGHGWYINGESIDRSVFSNCQANYCGSIGFNIVQGDRLHFTNCVSVSNTKDGFNLDNVDDCIFSSCQVTDNTLYGITLGTASSQNIVVGNNFRFNGTAVNNNQSGGTIALNIV